MLGFVFIIIPFIVNASKLRIISPQTVRDQAPLGFEYNIADFGFAPYGKTIHGALRTTEPFDACAPITLLKPQTPSHDDKINIIFVDRSNCTFVTQAFNAEQAGAQMLIIADVVVENVNKILLISDHTHHVQIPVIMLAKNDSDFLKNMLNTQADKGDILVSVTFEIKQSPKVNLTYFMSSMNGESYEFIRQFWPFHKSLEKNMDFRPSYVQQICYGCYQVNFTVANDFCISGGRYCAHDPDGSGPLLGKDVVLEDLRQLCIFQTFPGLWWQYEWRFFRDCFEQHAGQKLVNLTECSQNVQKELKIDLNSVTKCMSDSFEGPYPNFNDSKILRDQRIAFQHLSIPYFPSLLINEQFFKGDLYFENQTRQHHVLKNVSNYAVLEAICASYTPTNIPLVCDNTKLFEIKEQDLIHHDPQSKVSEIGIWLIVVGILVLFMGVAFFLYRRKLRQEVHKQMQEQVQQSLSQYYRYEDPPASKDDKTLDA